MKTTAEERAALRQRISTWVYSNEEAIKAGDLAVRVLDDVDALLAERDRLQVQLKEYMDAVKEKLHYDMNAVIAGTPERQAKAERDELRKERDALAARVEELNAENIELQQKLNVTTARLALAFEGVK